MNAAETIQAAIEKLETARDVSTQGAWVSETRGVGINFEGTSGVWYVAKDDGMHAVDKCLIVVLHRTIDAQLAILRAAHKLPHIHYPAACSTNPLLASVLQLARAILGDDS